MLETRILPAFVVRILLLLAWASSSALAFLPPTAFRASNGRPVSQSWLHSTATPEDVTTTAGIVYNAKKIRNFSIIAHIDVSCDQCQKLTTMLDHMMWPWARLTTSNDGFCVPPMPQ